MLHNVWFCLSIISQGYLLFCWNTTHYKRHLKRDFTAQASKRMVNQVVFLHAGNIIIPILLVKEMTNLSFLIKEISNGYVSYCQWGEKKQTIARASVHLPGNKDTKLIKHLFLIFIFLIHFYLWSQYGKPVSNLSNWQKYIRKNM